MSIEPSTQYYAESLPALGERDVADFTELMSILTGTSQETATVQRNVERALASESTTVYAVRQDPTATGPIVSTATLNRLPILSGRGAVLWVDDVVTHPSARGKGLSRLTMDAMEVAASLVSGQIFLTSTPERGTARTIYTNRGYDLYPDGRSVYRNEQLAQTLPSGTEILSTETASDISALAELLHQDPTDIALNLHSVLASVSTAVTVRREQQRIVAVAVANLCPIPNGLKPWIDDIAGRTAEDRLAVIEASEQWLRERGATYSNVVAASGDGLGEHYIKRTTGLFMKNLEESRHDA